MSPIPTTKKGFDPLAPALLARSLTRSYGHFPALRGVDLEIPRGTSFTLFGANGAGKTTLLRIASTLARPGNGSLHVAGFDVSRSAEQVRSRIGLLTHNTAVYRDLTPMENLRFFSRIYGLDPGDSSLRELLGRVGLRPRADDPVRTFSRGLLQRVGIARVMLHRPEVLLLDEPYTGLDAHAVGTLNHMLDDAVAEGRTVILTTHDLEMGLRAASGTAIMDRGKIVYSGAPGGETRRAYSEFVEKARSQP
jgi:heme exporter protein A